MNNACAPFGTGKRMPGLLLALVTAFGTPPAMARDSAAPGMAETTQVAGRELKLTSAGISARLIFKVYAMALYLLDDKRNVAQVTDNDEPRRVVIRMLRDVSGEEFGKVVQDYAKRNRSLMSAQAATQMLRIGQAFGRQPEGLRKGDTLTLDWVPSTGVVIELNRTQLIEPLRDIQFYNLLLSIWLGDQPVDPDLKDKLLHRPDALRAAVGKV